MSGPRRLGWRDPWLLSAVAATIMVALTSTLIGLVWLPLAQPGNRFTSVWDAICSAAGAPRRVAQTPVVQTAFKTSQVVFAPGMGNASNSDAIGHGGTLAQRCAICHGIRGEGAGDIPVLAGQHASAIIKELDDFKTGARQNAVMSPFAADLSSDDRLDLAAYYANLPRDASDRSANRTVPAIVVDGAPMRNIAPCSACHGGTGLKAGAPRLDGQSADYLTAQLKAFATGARHNDISLQMRNVAHGMNAAEMEAAVRYYAAQPRG